MNLEICNRYLDALNKGDLNAVLSLFEENAIVVSPLYGELDAKLFYQALFEDTNRSDTKLMEVFHSSTSATSIALPFLKYEWTLNNGTVVDFDCVDIFELASDKSQFKKLTIIYDTSLFREEFENLHN